MDIFFNVLNTIKNTILSVVDLIKSLTSIIPTIFDFLPNEIKVIFIPILLVIIIIFLYRFIR